MTHNN